MATSSVTFKSKEDHQKHIELEDARKAGFVPAEVDDEKNNQNVENVVSDEDNKDSLKVDDPGNLHIREDTARYFLNLNVNSAQYDPMCENPHPDSDRNENFFGEGNQFRTSSQALEFKQLKVPVWEAYELKGQEIRNCKRRAEFLLKNDKVIKESLKSKTEDSIMEKYGNATPDEELLRELLLGQARRALLPRKKYEEHVYINNHTTVWGSWWKDNQWGYKCCKQTIRNSYCTGAAGIEVAEAASGYIS